MEITGVLWLEDIVEKLAWKHNVTESEVLEVLRNKPKFRFVEHGHIDGENVYAALGQTYSGRYLIVLFVYKHGMDALIISARTMTTAEQKRYERK